LKKFVWLGLGLIYCVLLNSGTAFAQASKASPFDGMSAIDIRVAASVGQKAETTSTPTAPLETTTTSASSLKFLRCDLVELNDHPLHAGEFPIAGDPLPGSALARVEFNQFAQSVAFRLLNASGELLQPIELNPPENLSASTTFQGGFTVPAEPFRIAATGQDLDDQDFDVSCDRLYSPQTVELKADPENAIVSAGNYELSAVITNHGPQNTFAITASSDLGIAVTPSQELIELGPNESAPITLSLIIPQISSGVLDINIMVSATAENNANLTNHANATLWVERFETLFGDNFE